MRIFLHLLWMIPAGIVVQRIAWAILRTAGWALPSPALAARIGAVLMAARSRGHDQADALVAMTWQVDMPWCLRLARAGRALAAGEQPCAAAALGEARLLRPDAAALGAAAHAVGAAAETRWLADLANGGSTQGRVRAVAAYALFAGSVVMAVLIFVSIFIAPKFGWIMRDLGIPMAPEEQWLFAGWVPPLVLAVLAIAAAGALAWWWWLWRGIRRACGGGLLIAATASGLSEAGIAAAIAPALGRRRRRLVGRAGAAGDWRGLCSALGWRARDPADLARQVAAAQARRERLAILVATLARLLVPLVLAVPVWLLASSVFTLLIRVMQAIGDA